MRKRSVEESGELAVDPVLLVILESERLSFWRAFLARKTPPVTSKAMAKPIMIARVVSLRAFIYCRV